MFAGRAADSELLRGSTCGTLAVPIRDSPMISITVAIVLAVNCPPQAPAPGQALIFDVQQFLDR